MMSPQGQANRNAALLNIVNLLMVSQVTPLGLFYSNGSSLILTRMFPSKPLMPLDRRPARFAVLGTNGNEQYDISRKECK